MGAVARWRAPMRGCSRIWRRRLRGSRRARHNRWSRRSPVARRRRRSRRSRCGCSGRSWPISTRRYATGAGHRGAQAALPEVNPAIEVGTSTLVRTPSLNANLQQVMNGLKNLALAPGTNVAINALTGTVQDPQPDGPIHRSVPDGLQQLELLVDVPGRSHLGGDQLRLCPAGAAQPEQPPPAEQHQSAGRDRAGQRRREHIDDHRRQRVSPRAGVRRRRSTTQGNADCETGQRGYVLKLNHLDPQGRDLGTDAHTPGDQGPTYAGRANVPAGETFTRNPTTGPQLTSIPSNP